MESKIGPIFRLMRKELQLRQNTISASSNISKSKISDFEIGKRDLTQEEKQILFKASNLKWNPEKVFIEEAEKYLNEMFSQICWCSSKKDEIFEKVQNIKKEHYIDTSYITLLLCEFLYYVYLEKQNHFYQYEKYIKVIEQHIDYLSLFAKQVFYDTAGVYYDIIKQNELSYHYFDLSIHNYFSDIVLAMVYYHKAFVYVADGFLFDAYECAQKAQNLFVIEMNYQRIIMTKLLIGVIYNNNFMYERAEKIYFQLINSLDSKDKERLATTYNNLIWNYILWGKYEKVIEYSDIALKIDSSFSNFYVYRAFVFYKNDNYKESRKELKKAYIYEDNAYLIEKFLMKVLSSITSNRPFTSQEKRLLEAYEIAEKSNDRQLEIFILEMLSEICHKYHELEKEIDYQNKMIYLLKQCR